MKRIVLASALGAVALAALVAWHGTTSSSADAPRVTTTAPPVVSEAGIHKIKHVVVIMQENRSFDSYFGTYPGADGIPMKDGVPTGEYQDFVTGFVLDTQNVWGRPAGIAVLNDGSLLFTDDVGGRLWRVAYTGR